MSRTNIIRKGRAHGLMDEANSYMPCSNGDGYFTTQWFKPKTGWLEPNMELDDGMQEESFYPTSTDTTNDVSKYMQNESNALMSESWSPAVGNIVQAPEVDERIEAAEFPSALFARANVAGNSQVSLVPSINLGDMYTQQAPKMASQGPEVSFVPTIDMRNIGPDRRLDTFDGFFDITPEAVDNFMTNPLDSNDFGGADKQTRNGLGDAMNPEFDQYLGLDPMQIFEDANTGWRRLGDDDNNDEFEDGPLGPQRRLGDDDDFEDGPLGPERKLGDDDDDFEDGPLGPERRLDDDDAEFEAPKSDAIPIISPQAKATPLVFPQKRVAPIVRHNCNKPILNLLHENTAKILRMERLRSAHSSTLHELKGDVVLNNKHEQIQRTVKNINSLDAYIKKIKGFQIEAVREVMETPDMIDFDPSAPDQDLSCERSCSYGLGACDRCMKIRRGNSNCYRPRPGCKRTITYGGYVRSHVLIQCFGVIDEGCRRLPTFQQSCRKICGGCSDHCINDESCGCASSCQNPQNMCGCSASRVTFQKYLHCVGRRVSKCYRSKIIQTRQCINSKPTSWGGCKQNFDMPIQSNDSCDCCGTDPDCDCCDSPPARTI
jgi:hypothetical protein